MKWSSIHFKHFFRLLSDKLLIFSFTNITKLLVIYINLEEMIIFSHKSMNYRSSLISFLRYCLMRLNNLLYFALKIRTNCMNVRFQLKNKALFFPFGLLIFHCSAFWPLFRVLSLLLWKFRVLSFVFLAQQYSFSLHFWSGSIIFQSHRLFSLLLFTFQSEVMNKFSYEDVLIPFLNPFEFLPVLEYCSSNQPSLDLQFICFPSKVSFFILLLQSRCLLFSFGLALPV